MPAARSTTPHNRLARETSPYLQQHAANPVDWYPWGPEALERARREDKPILLSIGYSACHWCHVMSHESFDDPAVAAVMNERFINIKVDREERPDIDQIYQTAHQMLTQRAGGWPLTMFLAPDQVPFFGGTYFPKTPRHNLPGFVNIMERVELAFREKRHEITEQNAAIVEAFGRGDQADQPADPTAFSVDVIEQAIEGLAERFDTEHGGFGEAPKFPHPSDLALLLRHSAGHRDEVSAAASAHIALLTLRKMAEGGIYDHLGGGFCRYSVDRYWMIPHFEKMLYDNGPLLALYTDAWRITAEPLFAQVVAETAGWVMREMQSPEGGYYSSLDADSDGEEGKYYRWTQEEARALLPPAEFAIIEQYYGLVGHANFEGHYWHLNIVQSLAQTAERCGVSVAQAQTLLDAARVKLLAARERRIRPGRDEKILTSWNALAIAGMARAGLAFDRPEWIASARLAMDFLQRRLWRDGRLLATYKDDRAHLTAYLDDYAYTIAALLELAQAGPFVPEDLAFARSLADVLLAQFEDPVSGGFFFTANDHEPLIHRPKQGYDNATPSGNGVAAWALGRLGHLLGEPLYLDSAQRTIAAFYPSMQARPAAYGALLAALDEAVQPPSIVVLRGAPSELVAWQAALARGHRPDTIILAIPVHATGLPAALNKPAPVAGVNAYLCEGVTCKAPVQSLESLQSAFSGVGRRYG